MTHVLLRGLLIGIFVANVTVPSYASPRRSVDVSSPVSVISSESLEQIPSVRSFTDIVQQMEGNYPGVAPIDLRQNRDSCMQQPLSLGPRIKDSVNWSGLSAPGSFFYDQVQNGTITLDPKILLRDMNRGGGMTRIDPPTIPREEPASVINETRAELDSHLAESQKKLQKLVDKFGADNLGTAEVRRILEADIKITQDKIAALVSVSSSNPVAYTAEDLAGIDGASRELSREQLRRLNANYSQDLNEDGRSAQSASADNSFFEEVVYTAEELEQMLTLLTPEEVRRINTDPFGMGERPLQEAVSSPRAPSKPLTPVVEADYAAAFAAMMDKDVATDDVYEAYQQNVRAYAQMTSAERAARIATQQIYHQQAIRAEQMKIDEAERRRAALEALDQEKVTREERHSAERDAAREEVNRTTQQILSGIEAYVNNAGEYDPSVLKWISVSAEMQHETKSLADSVNRDYMRGESKSQAIELYRLAHADELKDKPWVELTLISMEHQAATLKYDAELVWLMTKELVVYGAMIDIATFWATAAAKGVGVARKAAQELAMQATLDAARKPTAYVVGEVMVNAAGQGSKEAAAQFAGQTGSRAVTGAAQTMGSTGVQVAGTQVTSQATAQATSYVASDAGESVVAAGVKELLEGPEIARTFWVKINILSKGAEAETRRLTEQALKMGIAEAEIKVAGNSPDAVARLIVERLGLKIVAFAEARPIYEISTRILSGSATQADRQLLEKMVAEGAAHGGNFFDDLARKGTFGDDGFQQIASADVINAMKNFLGTTTQSALDKTVQLAGQGVDQTATVFLENALEKTVQLAPEQAGRVALDAIEGALEKTVQLVPEQASGLAETVIDKVLDKTVQLTPAQVGHFINGVADDVLAKTVMMTEEQAFRMAQTMVENLMEHAPTLTSAELANMSATIIENVLDDTIRLSSSQVSAFIGRISEEVLAKTVQMSEKEAQNLTRSMVGQFMENAAVRGEEQTLRLAEGVVQDAVKTQILPSQVSRTAAMVIEDIMGNTTIITKDAAVALTETVVDGLLEKTARLSASQAQDMMSTVIIGVADRTLILGERDAADFVATVVGDVLERTVALSEDDVIKTVRLVVNDTLGKTMKLSSEQVDNVARTAGEHVLDHLALLRAPQGTSTLTQMLPTPLAPAATSTHNSAGTSAQTMSDVAESSLPLMADVTRVELESEQKSLLEQIAGMEKGLNEPIFKKNPALKETLVETLANAKERLNQVKGLLAADINKVVETTATLETMFQARYTDDFKILANYQQPLTSYSFGGEVGTFGSYLSDERYGELTGEAGPLLVKGTYHNQPGLAVYDSWGVPTGFVTRDEARYVPGHTEDLIRQADRISQRYAFEGGLGQWSLRAQSYNGYDYDPINAGRLPPEGFVPESVLVAQMGLSGLDAATFSDGINNQLIRGISGEKFFGPFSCCGVGYFDEAVYDRVIQRKKKKAEPQVIPNDPRFYDPKGERKSRRARRFMKSVGTTSSSFGLSFGGGSNSKGPVVVDQWGIREVGYLPQDDPDSAWRLVDAYKKNVVVAVIDSGFDMTHSDGPQYFWTNDGEIPGNGIDDDHNGFVDDVHGYNFLDNNADLTDLKGHGTNVAGIIAAKANNGIGIAGINPGAQMMILKVADKHGHANSLNIYRAIRYAANHGARVINISLGAWGDSKLEQLAINYAHRRGVFIVVAAGNENRDLGSYGPSGHRRVFAVGATDYGGARSLISNHGPNLALLAPGEKIYTLWAKDADWDGPSRDRERHYWFATGTSFSAPIVAATASLILAQHPEFSPQDIERILLATSEDMEEPGWDAETGVGFLDAQRALSMDKAAGLIAQITELRVNESDGKFSSLDVFASVVGDLKGFTLEMGRGKQPRKWQKVGNTYTQTAHNNWLCRIPEKDLKGNNDTWSFRLIAEDSKGDSHQAQTTITLK
jgi:subtilisin family serine protease